MARHRRYSLEFKRRVVQEHLADGMTLSALARHHDISRNLIRLWVEKHEAGEFDDDDVQADLLVHCRRRIAELVVLGHSRLLWLRFYRQQTMRVLFEGLESAFARFGGVPSSALEKLFSRPSTPSSER
ncbi:MAG: transposase [Chloroflexi bacterium]|nr:transposase [Chloroflexota bacterium]